METFTTTKDFVNDPGFEDRRSESVKGLDQVSIDRPIVDIIAALSRLRQCFTLQSCWGHFVHQGQADPHGLEPLAHLANDTEVKYRIAYLALCIRNCPEGRRLHGDLQRVARIDPKYIQFGSADWFWRQHVNSFVLQAEPERFQCQDTAMVNPDEALHIQSVRDRMFQAMRRICSRHVNLKIY